MRLLSRLIKTLGGAKPPGRPKPPKSTHVEQHGFEDRLAALEAEVLSLCAAGDTLGGYEAFTSGAPTPATAHEAQLLLRRVVMPILDACVEHGRVDEACRVEVEQHFNLIRRFEDPEHFEVCIGMIDKPMHALGLAGARPCPHKGDQGARRLLFFPHNIRGELAHVKLMRHVIDAFLEESPDEAANIGIAGLTTGETAPSIVELTRRRGISLHVWPLTDDNLAQPLRGVAKLVQDGKYDRLVVVSNTAGLSYLSGLLPPDRLCWLSMKYELSCFEHLQHRCSFWSGVRRARTVGGKRWLQAPPLYVDSVSLNPLGTPSAVLKRARNFNCVMYTINREEKIRNPAFLRRIARILREVKGSVFVWTGRGQAPDVDSFFASEGLSDRHLFAGWVVPDDLMQIGDLFLDTPILSGMVAAQATAVGVPVVMDADAFSWVGTFWPAFEAERGSQRVAQLESRVRELRGAGIELLPRGDDEYVRQAVRLARDAALRRNFAEALRCFASLYFFDVKRAAKDHFANLRAHVDA